MRQDSVLDAALSCIRPTVRVETPYHVGGRENIAVKLNQNESPFDMPQDVKRALARTFLDTPVNRYPGETPQELCAAIAEHVGWPVRGILVGNGSNDLMFTVATATIAAGTPVVLPRPLFSLYEKVVRLNDGKPVSVDPHPDLCFDIEGMLAAIKWVKPRLVILATPNNPTGLAVSASDVARIATATSGLVLVDEAYVEFCDEDSALTILQDFPNMLLLRTFSKAFGLAGLRLGFLVGHPAIVGELLKARYPFAVDRLAEAAALLLLRRPALLARRVAQIKRETTRLYERLSAMEGVDALRPQANFVIFRPPKDAGSVMNRLAQRGVLVRNMGGYPALKGRLRVSAGTEKENNIFLSVLESLLH